MTALLHLLLALLNTFLSSGMIVHLLMSLGLLWINFVTLHQTYWTSTLQITLRGQVLFYRGRMMENHLALQRISEKFILGKEITKKSSISWLRDSNNYVENLRKNVF